jgi:hypothetical protein
LLNPASGDLEGAITASEPEISSKSQLVPENLVESMNGIFSQFWHTLRGVISQIVGFDVWMELAFATAATA